MAKITSLLVVDIGLRLTLLNLQLHPKVKPGALKVFDLTVEGRDKIILDSLRNFIQENNILHRNAILKPSLDSLFIRRLQLPAIPESELPEAVKWQLKDQIPFDLSEAVMDFSALKEETLEDGSRVLDIICVLAREEEVRAQVLLLKQLGLACLAVVPSAFGYAKLFTGQLLERQEGAVGVLHLDLAECFLAIYKEQRLEFWRQLPLSVNKLKEALRGVLLSDKGRVELSEEEAGEVLFKIGIPYTSTAYKDKISQSQILSMLRPDLERLTNEMRRSLAYYTSQFKEAGVAKIFLVSLADKIPNLEHFLSQELSLAVERVPLQEGYASLALAVDFKQNINLLPYEFRSEKIEMWQRVSLRWISLLAGLLLFFSYLAASLGINAYKKRLDSARMHLNVLSEVRLIKTRTDEFSNFMAKIKGSGSDPGALLKKLSSIAPRELFIESLSLDHTSKALSIWGYLKKNNQNNGALLNKFVLDMQEGPYFSGVSISSLEKASLQDSEIIKFNISASLK